MIADSYLQLRNELETAVTDLLKLAGERRRTPPWLDMLQGFLVEIREPLVLVVLGESKSGKSSLLNAFFGNDFAMQQADGICVFQHGELNSVQASPGLRECQLPLPFLRDFKIVDTPGIESLLAQNRQLIAEFIARADLILLVFSLANPWTKSAWDLFDVEDMPLKNFVFVLQQADLREPREIEIIRQNLEDTATQKLGFTPPIFAVSARDALRARAQGSDTQQARKENQFEELKEQIALVITQSGGRTHKLRPAYQLAQVVLHDIASELRSSVDSVAHDEGRLVRAHALLEARKEQTAQYVSELVEEIKRACREGAAEGVRILQKKLSLPQMWKMLFGAATWLHSSEIGIETKLRKSLEQRIENAADALETELRGLWPQLHDLIDQQLVTELKEKIPRTVPDFTQQRQDLLSSIGRELDERASKKNASEVAYPYRKSNWLRAVAAVAAGGALAALLALKFNPDAAKIGAGVAIGAAALLASLALSRRRQILRAYERAAEDRAIELTEMIAAQFNRLIESFHGAVAEAFAPLTEYCAAQRRISEPVLRHAEELQRTLAGLGSRLR
jgi:GTPase SAR1 family protein/phage gpG-like protein